MRGIIVLLACLMLAPAATFGQGPPPAEGGGETGPPVPAPPRPNLKAIRKLRQRFEREPTVRDVQQAALRYFTVHPDKVGGYRTGARLKALVPEIEVSFNRENGDNTRRMIDALYEKVFRDLGYKELEGATHTTYSLGVRARWALDRLVFNAELLDVASLVGVQEGLLREITSLYFTRRRLMTIFALNPPQDPAEQITESVRLDEITANIDALTGGYFTTELERVKKDG